MGSYKAIQVPLLANNIEINTPETFSVTNPATNTPLWQASAATLKDVETVTEAAQAAFPAWSNTKYTKRRELIQRFQSIFESKQDILRECMGLETGAQESWISFNIKTGIELLQHIAGTVVTISGSIEEEQGEGRSAYVTREPYGVILEIVPWNAPIILLLRAIFFPVATGNTVIIKSSETSPRTHFLVTSIAVEAGFPPGVINLISHSRADAALITNALIAHRAVKKIEFTGSSAVARKLAAKAGEYLKPIILELGGKAPFIVLEDADVEAAAEVAAIGSWTHAGQVCMSTEKIIVHSSIIDRFSVALLAAAGNKINESQVLAIPGAPKQIKALVDDAIEKGAQVVNKDFYSNFDYSNNRFPNLVIRGITDKMELYHTESFGPLASIIEAPTEEEAVRIANDTVFGLASAVWTGDLARGLRISKRIGAGLCNINGPTFLGDVNLFPPGWNESGTGNLVSKGAFNEFLRPKITTFGI